MNYQALSTEESNPKSEFLDQMPALEIATLMNTLDATVIEAVRQALPQIAGTAEEAARRIAAGGRLFYVGAGTSGRLGVLDARPSARQPLASARKQSLALWRAAMPRCAMRLKERKMMPRWAKRTCGAICFAAGI